MLRSERLWGWIFGLLSVGACLVLGSAAVVLGGLNQDEGWYLYAANCVADGRIPYRDFFYTQGPLLPIVYSAFTGIWSRFGLLGARLFNLTLGLAGLAVLVGLVRRLVSPERRNSAALLVFLLLGSNLYHLYYLAIPKTYALAALFVSVGFYLLTFAPRAAFVCASGVALAFAAGTRISLGALLAVVGFALLLKRQYRSLVFFSLGGFAGLGLAYGPFLVDAGARAGLVAAQAYHAARGGFDPVWTVGSFSRLVRWYAPTFVVLALGVAGLLKNSRPDGFKGHLLLWAFLAVFAVQMLAPFPYEDYQVPVMGLLAVYAVTALESFASPFSFPALLVLALTFATSFGSPLLEKWMTNGQDRFWSIKKEKCELLQLRDVAREIEALDPDGHELLTQDLYLAIETGRRVPRGLEMGPFSMLTDAEWKKLLSSAPCRLAALSGYSFAIRPPACSERPIEQQMEFWNILKSRYEVVGRERDFGQNATTLMILRRKEK